MNRYNAMSNYHLMSDTPENVNYGTVEQTVAVTAELARALA